MAIKNAKEILARIKSNIDKFLTYNKQKLDNLNNSISDPDVLEVFESIPLFLNYNIPELPGFVESEKVPMGARNVSFKYCGMRRGSAKQ